MMMENLMFLGGGFQFYCLQLKKSDSDGGSAQNFSVFPQWGKEIRAQYIFSMRMKIHGIFITGDEFFFFLTESSSW